jgi:hypothetical protein
MYAQALWWGCADVLRRTALPLHQRMLLVALKAFAVTAF